MDAAKIALVEVVRMLLAEHKRVDPHHEDICPICKAAENALVAVKNVPDAR